MRSRPVRRVPILFESLEERALLAGVTVIAHGAQFLTNSRPDWVDTMAAAIRTRMGASTAIYVLELESSNNQVVATDFTRIAGPAPTSAQSTNNETVLIIDWGPVSHVNLVNGGSEFSTTTVATAILPYLLNANVPIGLTAPLAEGAIQLIGHSRGASLTSELARLLGQRGIWVDQLTSLDPVPVPPDPLVVVRQNVVFADTYFQTEAVTHGTKITGAFNSGPLNLGGAYGLLDGNEHGDVHLYYHGTINTASNASDGEETVPTSWYPSNNTNRTTTGFFYTHLVRGARPASGVGNIYGGTAARTGLTRSGVQWANVGNFTLSSTTLNRGQSFSAAFQYNSFSTASVIGWFLDPDTNPYNGNSIPITDLISAGATGDVVIKATANLVANVPVGTWFLESRVSNAELGGGTRYSYSAAITVLNPAPIGAVDVAGPLVISGWAGDQDAPAASVAVRLDIDGVLFATGTANLSRPDLVPIFGTAAHGFSFDLSAVATGIHRADVYATDTVTGVPTLIGTRTVFVNRTSIGSIDLFNATTLSGWVGDPDAGASPTSIRYQIDNFEAVIVSANGSRPDLTGILGSPNHGYSVNLSQLNVGSHTVAVHAIDIATGGLTLLGTRSITVTVAGGVSFPLVSLDVASATLYSGWIFDSNTPSAPVSGRIDIDGVTGTPFTANVNRPDLVPVFGAANLGFSQALTLTPGQHRVDFFAIDDAGAAVLMDRRIINGAPPGTITGFIEVANATTLSGWLWSAAMPASGSAVRIDIDGLPGVIFPATVARPDVNASLGVTGNHGFSLPTPRLAPGTHTVTLLYLDTLSFRLTAVFSTTFVTA